MQSNTTRSVVETSIMGWRIWAQWWHKGSSSLGKSFENQLQFDGIDRTNSAQGDCGTSPGRWLTEAAEAQQPNHVRITIQLCPTLSATSVLGSQRWALSSRRPESFGRQLPTLRAHRPRHPQDMVRRRASCSFCLD